jgi:hypothetical protein
MENNGTVEHSNKPYDVLTKFGFFARAYHTRVKENQCPLNDYTKLLGDWQREPIRDEFRSVLDQFVFVDGHVHLKSEANPSAECVEKTKRFAPLMYAYQQSLFAPLKKFRGLVEGDPPRVKVIRTVTEKGYRQITDSNANEEFFRQKTIGTQKFRSVESWALLEPTSFDFGGSGFFGEISTYSILTSYLASAFWINICDELLIMPCENCTLDCSYYCNRLDYFVEVSDPYLMEQYPQKKGALEEKKSELG